MAVTSYIKLVHFIEEFANLHEQVQRFQAEIDDQLPNFATDGEAFPVLFISPVGSRFGEYADVHTINVYCYSRLTNDRSNVNNVYSDTQLILNDLKKYIQSGDNFLFDIIGDVNTIPMREITMDYVFGNVMTLDITVDTYSVCEIPLSDSPDIPFAGIDITYSQYLTCESLANCDIITTIQGDISELSATTSSLVISASTFETQITTLQTEFYIGVNFIDAENFQYVAPEQFKITSIDNPDSLVLTTTVNGSPYVLGNTISLYDDVLIVPNTTGFIKLNCEIV